jgi:hypothetical protein
MNNENNIKEETIEIFRQAKLEVKGMMTAYREKMMVDHKQFEERFDKIIAKMDAAPTLLEEESVVPIIPTVEVQTDVQSADFTLNTRGEADFGEMLSPTDDAQEENITEIKTM